MLLHLLQERVCEQVFLHLVVLESEVVVEVVVGEEQAHLPNEVLVDLLLGRQLLLFLTGQVVQLFLKLLLLVVSHYRMVVIRHVLQLH